METVCEQLSLTTPEVAEAALTAWVKHQGDAVAAAELAAFIVRSARPTDRLFALMGIAQTGEHGLAEGQRLRAGGGIPGSVTVGWLVEQGAITAESVTQEKVTIGMTDHFAALPELDSFPADLLELPVDEQISLIHLLTTVDHPSKLELLDVIAAEHPERKIAKAARKARLKPRTAGIQR